MPTLLIEDTIREQFPPLVPITVDQLDQMMRAGIVAEGAPIELIDGLLVRKDRSRRGDNIMSHGTRHALIVKLLSSLLSQWAKSLGHHLQIQLPIVLSEINAPEPDAALIRGVERDYADRLPCGDDVLLAIEVADSSVTTDRTTKQRLYATAGIPTYWLINIPKDQVEVFEQPDRANGKYLKQTTLVSGRMLAVLLPTGDQLEIAVADLLR